MKQVQQSIDKGLIISARDLSSKGALSSMTNEDKILFDKGFRKNTSKLKKHGTIILEGTSHEISTKHTLMTSFTSSKPAHKNCNQLGLVSAFPQLIVSPPNHQTLGT